MPLAFRANRDSGRFRRSSRRPFGLRHSRGGIALGSLHRPRLSALAALPPARRFAFPLALLVLVLRRVPRHAGADLLKPYIARAFVDIAHDPIPVTLAAVCMDVAIEGEARQARFRRCPERLTLLRRVDSRNADLVLRIGAIEDRQRVTVGDSNDAAFDEAIRPLLRARLEVRRRGARATMGLHGSSRRWYRLADELIAASSTRSLPKWPDDPELNRADYASRWGRAADRRAHGAGCSLCRHARPFQLFALIRPLNCLRSSMKNSGDLPRRSLSTTKVSTKLAAAPGPNLESPA